MKKRNFFKFFIVMLIAVAACLTFTACSGTDFNGAGAGVINITLAHDYGESLDVSCSDGKVEAQSTTEYRISTKTRKMTEVIFSCEGYYTQTLRIYTKDYVDGVANKNDIELVKRYNVLTLSVAGVATEDFENVTVTSDKEGVLHGDPVVSGRKIQIAFNDFEADAGELTTLSVSCENYYTNDITIEAGYFFDYEASMSVRLIKTSSNDISVTFINDLEGREYYLWIYNTYGLDVEKNYRDVIVKTSTNIIIDRKASYYIDTNYSEGYTPLSFVNMPQSEPPYVTLKLSELGKIYENSYDGEQEPIQLVIPQEIREFCDTYVFKDGMQVGSNWSDALDERVKAGDTVRIVAYDRNSSEIVSYYDTEIVGNSLTVEADRIKDDIKITFRYVDQRGNFLKLSDVDGGVKVYNGYHYDSTEWEDNYYFAEWGNEEGEDYIDITDPNVSAFNGLATSDEYTVTVDVKEFLKLKTRQGQDFSSTDYRGRYLYTADGTGQYIWHNVLYIIGGDYCDILITKTVDFKVRFYKYDGNGDIEYVTGLSFDRAGFTYETSGEYYIISAADLSDECFYPYKGEGSQRKDYERLHFLVLSELYKKDGNYCVMDLPLYEQKKLKLSFTGDQPPQNINFDIRFDNGSFYVERDYDPNDPNADPNVGELVIKDASQRYIGKKFSVYFYDNGNVRYEASGTFTQQMFDSGVFEIKLRRIEINYN